MDDLLSRLQESLGTGGFLSQAEAKERPAGWGLEEPCQALAILRPQNTAEVSRILELCHQADQAICVQGGMTGVVQGGVASSDEIVLSLERMTEIEDIDPVGRTMTVQAGVPLQRIQEEAHDQGLFFPLDLGARGSCQIGGNVATNAGGNRVIRYGMTRRLVLGLETVLADGTVLSSLNRMVKNNSGYDLKQLFIGSEGTLGVVTRVVLRLERKPKSHSTALAGVESFDKLLGLLGALEENLGPQMSAFEVMWKNFYELVTTAPAKTPPPLPYRWPYYVLIEALGNDRVRDSDRFDEVLAESAEQGFLADAVIGRSRKERDGLWSMRDDLEQVDRLGPHFTFDVSLPIREMDEYVNGVGRNLNARWPDVRWVVFGHLGDGNLHPIVGVGDPSPAARRAVEAIIYDPLHEIGGAVSAEHGIGLEKRAYLSISRTPEEIDLMRRLKKALDPKEILNPGRVFEL